MNPRKLLLLVLAAALLFPGNAPAAVRYVSLLSTNPLPPYSGWSTAATNIQDAVDAAGAGDEIHVSNGLYQAGSRVTLGNTTNRVAVTKAISLQSVNGAAVTLIDGGATMRCVYLTNGASLSGFTLTNGTAASGAGLYCADTSAVVSNCVLINNVAGTGGGGGTFGGTLYNCTLSGNKSPGTGGNGGGAASAVLYNCTLSGNSTGTPYPSTSGSSWGGGAASCTLSNCTVSGNSCYGAGAHGGGAIYGTANNCRFSGNSADHNGGAAYGSVMTNCLIWNNGAGYGGGGVCGGTIINSVITGNDAGFGGGVYWTTTLRNCIVYYNYGGNIYNTAVEYCCTDAAGVGNVSAEPQFVNRYGDFHLLPSSPCINAGINSWVTTAADYDGNLRIAGGRVDMGAYEYQQPNPMAVSIQASCTNIVVGFPIDFTGLFTRGTANAWDFADGTVVSNQVFVSHCWASPGDYLVTLTVYDSSNPGGVSASFLAHVISPPVSYVDPGSTNPVPPFSSWQTAATNIQDAVDAVVFGAHVVVTNSVWQSGGRVAYGSMTNRLVVNKPVVVESVNGPAVTVIRGNPVTGDTAVRCVYLTSGASLRGFTLLEGATRAAGDSYKEQSGGAIWCESTNALVSNCVIISNSASVYGGGIRGGCLSNCSLVANSATGSGGGAYLSLMRDCQLSNNTAILTYGGISGGGASSCTLVSCLLVSNVTDTPWSHPASGGGAVDSTLMNCWLLGNSGRGGGGAANSTLTNCLLFFNQGDGAGASGSTLASCLIVSNRANGWACGGGASGSALINCVIAGNCGYAGGGSWYGTLQNCLVLSNTCVSSAGGGACNATLTNCTVVGNSALYAGGGVQGCTVWNSIISGNAAPAGPDWNEGTLNYCCTTPLPPGEGNITNAPLFMDQPGGNFQLQSNSPCINAGTNFYTPLGLDLAGASRIVGGTIDLGPYECQLPGLLACYNWLQSYGLSTHASQLYADADADGMNNWQEWVAGTVPTNGTSVLRLQSVVAAPACLRLRWSSEAAHSYFMQRASSLNPVAFSLVRSNISGLPGATEFTDTALPVTGPVFYRVGTAGGGTAPMLERPLYQPATVTLSWPSVTNRFYFVERSTDLPGTPALLRTNIAGLAGATSFTDSNPPTRGPAFYRIGVQP